MTVYALESDHNPSPNTVTTSGRRTMAVRPRRTEASLQWMSP